VSDEEIIIWRKLANAFDQVQPSSPAWYRMVDNILTGLMQDHIQRLEREVASKRSPVA
jgi:hypothetical protein